MSADCGIELKEHNVTMLSLYPGAVKTELVDKMNSNEGIKASFGDFVCLFENFGSVFSILYA